MRRKIPKQRLNLCRSAPPYKPLREALFEANLSLDERRSLVWRARVADCHGRRLVRNAIMRQMLQMVIGRSNSVLLVLPIPRYPRRHRHLLFTLRSSARSKECGALKSIFACCGKPKLTPQASQK